MAVRVYLQTFGCRANQYDSEALAAMISADGCELVSRPDLADVAVFNSCAVTSEAEADLRQQVRKAARSHAMLRSVVMGCAAARSAEQIRALPSVTDVIAGADLRSVAAAIGLSPSASTVVASQQRGSRALLRIQDGCDEHCTFCATTLARGGNRSRLLETLVEEAKMLAEHHPEIVLTGIHIGTYGADLGMTLGALLDALVQRVPTVRFRLSSVEATEVDAQLADLLTGDATRVAPYLHAPLQSGSDAVLKRMGRHWYTAQSYAAAIDRLVGTRTTFGLGADLITGFPGETDADHAATLSLVESLPFSGLHVFPYSPRPGTAALKLRDDVPPAVRKQRAAELRALAGAKAAAYANSRVGGQADVVVIGHDDGQRDGMTEDYLTVELSEPAPARATRFVATLVRASSGVTLLAEPIS